MDVKKRPLVVRDVGWRHNKRYHFLHFRKVGYSSIWIEYFGTRYSCKTMYSLAPT